MESDDSGETLVSRPASDRGFRIGLIGPDVPGHLNPMTCLGKALKDRGHQVTLLGGRQAEQIAKRRGLDFVVMGNDDGSADALKVAWDELGRLSGFASMRQTGKALYLSAAILLRQLPEVLDRRSFDGLIVDQLSPAALTAADARDLPYVIACNALAMHYDPYMPPPPMPWRYRRDWIGWLRNQWAKQVLVPLYEQLAGARSLGVRQLKLVFDPVPGLARISQQPSFFDFPIDGRPEHFHYTAPWHTAGRDNEVAFPWSRLDGRPLIYASMGTLQNNQRLVFQGIIDAVASLPVQVVVTRGGARGTLDLDLTENVILVQNAPQLELLDRATLAITHAGLNTVMECLARGVPMVCLPVTNDQPGVAMRVEWLGAGVVLPVARLTAMRLRRLIEQVLSDSQYAETARKLRDSLPDRPGVSMAADIVEQAFQTRKRVLASAVL